MEKLLAIINLKYIILYILIINLIGFFSMGIDKFKAKKGYWRIPEGTLIMITVFGGGIGTFLGMYTFRHKTKKMKFTIGIPTIVIAEIIILIFIISDLYKLFN